MAPRSKVHTLPPELKEWLDGELVARGFGDYVQLAADLKARGIKTVFVTGLATDFCVGWTAMDARKAGFEIYVIEDACRAIDLNGSLAAAWKQMGAKGVKRIQSGDIDLA